jgi:hypothetical protein
MAKKVATKAARIARATALALGAALMLAVVLGVATTAVAGTGAGATFNLGQTNTVNVLSKLVGSVGGPSLQIANNSTGANATALELQVEAGKAPMKVNSGAKVFNLNADKIDGKDSSQFLGTTYVNAVDKETSANNHGTATASCFSSSDRATGGGVELRDGTASKVFYFSPSGTPVGDPPTAWRADWFADDVLAKVRVYVVCAT